MKNILIKSTLLISLIAMFSCGKEVRETKYPLSEQLFDKYEVSETSNGSFLKDGFYKQWHLNGQIAIDCNYDENKLNGEYKSFYDNGQIQIETNYSEDYLDGEYLKYYKNGQKMKEGQCKKGKDIGNWKMWLENGQLEYTFHKNDNGQLDGLTTKWLSDGKKASETNYKNGIQEGVTVEYYSNGSKKSEKMYVNDKLDESKSKYWTESGDDLSNIKKEIIGSWKDENSKTTFFENGNFTTKWDNGQSANGNFELNANELSKSNSSLFSFFKVKEEIIEFKKDKITIKDESGKLWHLVRIN